MKVLLISAILVVATCAIPTENVHPLSDEYIKLINEKATTWKAGKNFDVEDYKRVKRMASGVLNMGSLRNVLGLIRNPHDELEAVPETFDARVQYPKCEAIQEIRDQSGCGSCWALATVEAISDRICIQSNQKLQTRISAEDLVSCCDECGNGCNGGMPYYAWMYYRWTGIVTGGLYKANQGCKDYTLQPCEHHMNGSRPQCSTLHYDTPDCVKKCQNSSIDYEEDLHHGHQTVVLENEKQMQLEIYKNGPISVDFTVYDDFPLYKSGVYQPVSRKTLGSHAVKCIGWGVENGTKYWLIANSWNTDWGDKGFFKIIRGVNSCGIESEGFGSLPNLK